MTNYLTIRPTHKLKGKWHANNLKYQSQNKTTTVVLAYVVEQNFSAA